MGVIGKKQPGKAQQSGGGRTAGLQALFSDPKALAMTAGLALIVILVLVAAFTVLKPDDTKETVTDPGTGETFEMDESFIYSEATGTYVTRIDETILITPTPEPTEEPTQVLVP